MKLNQVLIEGGIVYGNPEMEYPETPNYYANEDCLPFEDQETIKDVFWAHEAAGLLKDGLYSVDLDVTVVEQCRYKNSKSNWADVGEESYTAGIIYEYRKVLRIN